MKKQVLFYNRYVCLVQLMRIHQPVGFFLLLWPTLWGLWLANSGMPDVAILMIFIIGALCMRSAGCIINDYIDRRIDCHVYRTKDRPLTANKVTIAEALVTLLILIVISAILVFNLNVRTIFLSSIALILVGVYPYLKRYIYFPQVILGIVFSWPILMAFSATNHNMNSSSWLLFISNIIWTMSYDTQYAMIDRVDDQRLGLKSLALLCRNMDRFLIGVLQLITVLILGIIGWQKKLSIFFYFFALFCPIILMIWQQCLIYERIRSKCFKAFLNNNYIGFLVFIGFVFSDLSL